LKALTAKKKMKMWKRRKMKMWKMRKKKNSNRNKIIFPHYLCSKNYLLIDIEWIGMDLERKK